MRRTPSGPRLFMTFVHIHINKKTTSMIHNRFYQLRTRIFDAWMEAVQSSAYIPPSLTPDEKLRPNKLHHFGSETFLFMDVFFFKGE